MKLTAPNYRFTVTCDNDGTISLHDAAGVLIGGLSGHSAPLLGDDVDALWDAAQWLLLAPQDGSGVDGDYWDNHAPAHYAWLCGTTNREDILLDFAEAAANEGCRDAALWGGFTIPAEHLTDAERREQWLDAEADAKYDAMMEADQ